MSELLLKGKIVETEKVADRLTITTTIDYHLFEGSVTLRRSVKIGAQATVHDDWINYPICALKRVVDTHRKNYEEDDAVPEERA